jgi:hypothetical protein
MGLGNITIHELETGNNFLIKTFKSDELPQALEYCREKNFIKNHEFHQWDEEDDMGSLMVCSVDEVNELFKQEEYFYDLTFL